ncbi:GroES-like protein [Daldinia loculata]|uniref:GroES-like protein n=1 Tax=Daldinia loculata TaxID=103429 RepID=UPI0020C51974|nr:GroES-like protein [Daldinia loculata]KAI1647471.1 GroES-like protein [Daldinia loculata]
MPATNRSLWQDKPGVPGVIRESPIPSKLEEHQLLIKVRAWAINPCDAIIQDKALPFFKYPIILGQDVSGTVEAVGSGVAADFKVGDRVFGFTVNNGFQDYVILDQRVTAKIPDSLSYAQVAVFPLCLTTCSFSLFSKDYLGLPFPTLSSASTDKSLLVWGGSSACGSNGIQLAKGAGFRVITTCSARNFDYVKSLGADKVFDRNSPTIVDDVAAELDKGACVGIYMAAGNVAEACQVAYKSKQKPFVASTNPVVPEDVPEGVTAKFTFGTGGDDPFAETRPVTFGGYFRDALHKGVYKVAPAPEVVSRKGLDGIQGALDIFKKGVSSKKLVVEAE